YQDPEGRLGPGLGAWVRAVEYATRSNALIMGKPSRCYFETALHRLGTAPHETVMISDDPFNDLPGAKELGIRTLFVTGGKYRHLDSKAIGSLPVPPDFVIENITQIPF
ncbi:HAD hydrolase-like protein, partial [bacterium]|nr:HAD hydrolase-like protein [candidate division CSSED10-310 bacterium]